MATSKPLLICKLICLFTLPLISLNVSAQEVVQATLTAPDTGLLKTYHENLLKLFGIPAVPPDKAQATLEFTQLISCPVGCAQLYAGGAAKLQYIFPKNNPKHFDRLAAVWAGLQQKSITKSFTLVFEVPVSVGTVCIPPYKSPCVANNLCYLLTYCSQSLTSCTKCLKPQ